MGVALNTLSENGIGTVFHVAPLHYLPFIARTKSLKSKETLRSEGFSEAHFRSKSKHLDAQRGFGNYIHFSTVARPPILLAKLDRGFPHICLSIPAEALDGVEYDLCRYNVAMSRQLRRGNMPGFAEGPENGRYYGDRQIPIARSKEEQTQLISSRKGKMLEVLCTPPFALSEATSIATFSAADHDAVLQILEKLDVCWTVTLSNAPNYSAREEYSVACQKYIEISLEDPAWMGDGLEFDKV